MRASYRRHRLWRSATRTRYLLGAAVVVALALVVLDAHRRPERCTYYYDHAYRKTIAGRCVPDGQRPPTGWTVIP